MKTLTLLNVLIVFCYATTFSQQGTLDPSFGNAGIVRLNAGSPVFQFSSAKQTIEAPDKSLYMLLETPDGRYASAISRRFSNGALDSAYGTGGFSVTIPIAATAAALQADGKVVVVGTPPHNGNYYFNLFRFKTDGTLDTAFGNNGRVNIPVGGTAIASSLLVQSDGKIVVAGWAGINGKMLFAVARYNEDGSADNSFNGNGQSFPDFGLSYPDPGNGDYAEQDGADAVVQQADGKLVVAGHIRMNDLFNPPAFAMVRYNTDGSFDSSFGDNGHQFVSFAYVNERPVSLGLQSSGKIILGTSIMNTDSSKLVAFRYNINGAIDSSFGTNGTAIFYPHLGWIFGNHLSLQSDDKIIMGGNTLNYPAETGNGRFIAVRFTQDGKPDSSFGGNGTVITDFGNSRSTENSITIQQDDRLILSGVYTAADNSQTLEVARYTPNGQLDASFDEDGKLFGTFIQGETVFNATAVQPDGKVLAAGYTRNGTNAVFLLTRYMANGKPDSSFAVNGVQVTDITPGISSIAKNIAIQADGRIVLAGITGGGLGALAVARYNVDGSLDASFNGTGFKVIDTLPGATAQSLVLQRDGKILIGANAGNQQLVITRLNADATLDESFNNTGTRTTTLSRPVLGSSIAIQKDGKIVQSGTYYYSNTQGNFSGFALVRYNTDGSTDNSFGTNGQQLASFGSRVFRANGIAIQNDGKTVVAGESFLNDNSDYRLAVARYQANGQLDSSFNNNGLLLSPLMGRATSIATSENGKIVLGGTTTAEGSNGSQSAIGNFSVVVLNADGIPDAGFGNNAVKTIIVTTGTGIASGVNGLAFGDGALVAAGFGSTPGLVGVITKFLFVTEGPLPVTITTFTAALKNKTTLLKWQTSAEYNLSHFLLQRSADGNAFYPLSTIKAKGSANASADYTETDLQPLHGLNYYRLQSVDMDGSIAYSKVVRIDNTVAAVIKLYPNPAHEMLYLYASGNNEQATAQIVDGSGKTVNTIQLTLNQNGLYPVNIQRLPKGVYSLKLVIKSGTTTLRFIKE